VKVLDEILLTIVSALSPEGVKEMVSLGLSAEVRKLIWELDEFALACRNKVWLGDGKSWVDVNTKLDELWVALQRAERS
jgi:hypothetical protein